MDGRDLTASQCLLIEFVGEVANEKLTNDAHFMDVVITAALTAWECHALILNLRRVRYVWGDWMQSALGSGRRRHRWSLRRSAT